jgi:serine/threonine-protein kinase
VATPGIADSVGRVLGDRYRLIRPLGVGASAHVYVAEDVQLRRRVAIKLLHPALAVDEAFGRRFRAEAQVVASLRHPNILRVYDWGYDGGAPYLVMELLEGGSLRSLLDRGCLLSAAQAATIGADAARALDYAHRRGLVHRDIKPANLIFDDEGRLTVADFGLARALAEATWTEPAGAIVGTARYAAPEQVRGQALDSRADVYSLALVLIEGMTGTVPFATDTTLGTLMARVERPLVAPEAVGPLAVVLDAAGTVDPHHRLDAGQLADQLDDVALRLPPPFPLPLVNPTIASDTEYDLSPTDYPGRPRLFDGAPYLAPAEGVASRINGDGGPDPSAFGPQAPTGAGAGAAPAPPRARRRGRGRRALAIVALVVVLAALGTAAALVRSRAFTASHPVPDLVGQTTSTAAAALRPLHFHLGIAGRAYAGTAAGSILSQRPAFGKLQEGSVVAVTVSLGPRPVPVPSLTGLSLPAAAQVLRTLHLGLVTRYRSSMSDAAGVVISNAPAGGTLLPDQAVTVVVSTGKPKVPVPPLTGAPVAIAARELGAAGLYGRQVDQYSDTVARGVVIGTAPSPGFQTTVGSTVTLVVSRGPHLVTIPLVRGMSVNAASLQLSALGFQISGVAGNPIATVSGTAPPEGVTVHYGAAVQLVTS